MILIVLLGYYLKNRLNSYSIILLIIASSCLFFILSNFGVWLIGYPKTLEGMISCYILAIPFFKNTILSTLFYSGIIFTSHYLLTLLIPKLNYNNE